MSGHSLFESMIDQFSQAGGKYQLLLVTGSITLLAGGILYWTRLGNRRLIAKCLGLAALLHLLVAGAAHEYHLFLKGQSDELAATVKEERIPIQLAPIQTSMDPRQPLLPIDDPRDLANITEIPLESQRKALDPDTVPDPEPPAEDPLPAVAAESLPKIEEETVVTTPKDAAAESPELQPDVTSMPEVSTLEAPAPAAPLLPDEPPLLARRPESLESLRMPAPPAPVRPAEPVPEPVAPALDAPKNSQGLEGDEDSVSLPTGVGDDDLPLDPISPPMLAQETPTESAEEPIDSSAVDRDGLGIRAGEEGMLGRRRRGAESELPIRKAAPVALPDAEEPAYARLLPLPGGVRELGGIPGSSQVAHEMTAVWRNRRAPDRMNIVERFGGSLRTEQAVADALAWLAAHQTERGYWDCDHFFDECPEGDQCTGIAIETGSDAGVTGLALLTFLGAGHTHKEDSRYRETIDRGLRWIRSIQRPDGDLRLTGRIYCHAMVTLCLCEAYAMTNDPELMAPAQKAIDWLCSAQNVQSGGWRYGPGQFGDTSVYGWAVLSLRSARNAGLKVPDQTWARSQRWLTLVSSGARGGLACYRPGMAPTHAMTAEALVCRQIFGLPRADAGMAEAGDYLLSRLPDPGDYHLYYWYYGTLAMFQLGGEHWNRWNLTLTNTLLASQKKTGHQRGSWDPEKPFGVDGGRVFSTACSALCLEVYYRYLPLYASSGTSAAEANQPPAK